MTDRVSLFVTCLVDVVEPEVGVDAVRVLRAAGCEVAVPDGQTCCGQVQYNTGYRHETEPLVHRMAEVFAGYDHVVAPSGSCAAMVRDNYPRIGA